ncbi:hypothetical protein [Emticicia sp. TH156]|uniref:hypothetical protein n=1 Tax=Emticicia sp. TH156 TaxID=2067454 RepID=UPI00117D1130|nr:hypothetical protein [Emticicia sp. TH156]
MFNTREIAYFIWGLLFVLFLFYNKDTRLSSLDLINKFFNKYFVYAYLIAIAHTFLCIAILYKIKIWDASLIKDTIMWIIFVALPLMYEAVKTNKFKKFVEQIVKPLVTFSVIFEYITGLYTFDLWIELLIIPLSIFIGGMLAISALKPEKKQVQSFINRTVSFMGLMALVVIIIHFYYNYKDYLNKLTFLQFFVPWLLSIMFLPLLYGISMFTQYESTLNSLKWHLKDQSVFKYTRLKIMLKFNADLDGVERWKNMIFGKNLQSRQEIDQAIILIKTLQKAERNPPKIDKSIGWSPYRVKDLLNSKGIQMSDYNNNYEDEFYSISNYLNLTDDFFFPDTIIYSVLSKQLVATELHLGLKIFNGTINNDSSKLKLLEFSEIIYESAFGESLPKRVQDAIINAHNYITNNSLAKLSVEKQLWTNDKKGYNLNFKITHTQHSLKY